MSSVLNPEAPEFYPHIKSLTEESLKPIQKTVRTSNAFPRGKAYNFLKTFPKFNVVTSRLSEAVMKQANRLVLSEMCGMKLKRSDPERNREIITDSNDFMLDRFEINMDKLNNVDPVSGQPLDSMKAGSSLSPWNMNPVISRIQMGSTLFIGAKNIPRPQMTFKDRVDNTENLWVPKISDKPNNIKPLALTIIYNDNGDAVGYEHPYKVELELYEPPAEFIEPDSEAPTFPLPMDQTKFTYIQTESELDELVNHLNEVRELAVDLEHHSYRTYQGITCLIQISTDEGGDFIIDAMAVREHVHKLNSSFTDPKKLKVLHGADMDVLWLQRDFGVYIVGLFDTFQAAKLLQIQGMALKNLLFKYCEVNADKKYQLADWRIRPLPNELVEYARMDTHYLLYVWRRMKSDILANENGLQVLRSVFLNSKTVCGSTYNKTVVHDNSHLELYHRSKRAFNVRQMAALKMLYKWRDVNARILDESVTYLLPNHMMLTLAETLPREVQGVNACCTPMPPFIRQNVIALHRMILSCRELPLETVPVEVPTSSDVPMVGKPVLPYDVHDLSEFPKLMRNDIKLDQAKKILNEAKDPEPALTAMLGDEDNTIDVEFNRKIETNLLFTPYNRYRGYRQITKDNEIKDIENKESKILALSKGDPLIKREVLLKLQESKIVVEQEKKEAEVPVENIYEPGPSSSNKTIQRKRKMSKDNRQPKNEKEQQFIVELSSDDDLSNSDNEKSALAKSSVPAIKPFLYENANYISLYLDRDESRKEPKTKFKKHK